jgi:orotidine-5'-phosphate decarboxylase
MEECPKPNVYVGATKAEYFTERRLFPIVSCSFRCRSARRQSEVCKYGMNGTIGLLINSSRGIIYASNGIDFAESKRRSLKMQQEMEEIIG